MSSVYKKTGVLLVGHGTRSAQGVAEFLQLAREVEESLAPQPVEPAFLELAEPPIADGFSRLIERGVRRVVVAPLLLFAAGHAKEDIPAAVREAASILPAGEIDIVFAQPMGSHPALLELSGRHARHVLGNHEFQPPGDSCLLLVGRGSRDPEAIAATHDYARQLQGKFPSLLVRVAFVAMAEPRVSSVADELSQASFERIVVQPHLLFHGELYESLAELVRLCSRPGQEWRLAPYLASGSLEARQDPRVGSQGDPSLAANSAETPAVSGNQLLLAAVLDRIHEVMPAL
jgi:sirohydrochlorin cobaltochelatase